MSHAPGTPIGDIGERELLRLLRARVPAGEGVRVGIGDDAAALETTALTLVTTDCLVEGVHFRREWAPPRLLGRKALSVSLSDVAAMGGVPRFATVSLFLPPDTPLGFVDGLYDGLLERAAEAGVSLVGGNLSRSRSGVQIDVALLGVGDRLLRRSGARPGDLVVVTGSLGAAAAGLRLLEQGARLDDEGHVVATGVWTESSAPAIAHCLQAQLDPAPPVAFARALVQQEQELVHAAMDISDGLSSDLPEICRESGVSAWIDPGELPVDAKAVALERARGGRARDLGLNGGEDYQLLLAVAPQRLPALQDLAVVWDLPLTVIGGFGDGEARVVLRHRGAEEPLPAAGHDPFRLYTPSLEPR